MAPQDELIALVEDLRSLGRLRGYEAAALIEGLRHRSVKPLVADWLTPSRFDAESLRDWIRDLCSRMHVTPTILAAKSGVEASTINKFLADTDGCRNISANTINSIVCGCQKIFADAPECDASGSEDVEKSSAADAGLHDLKSVGEIIMSARKENGITQRQIANHLHISVQAVSQWENGKSRVNPSRIQALGEMIGVNPDRLIPDEYRAIVSGTSHDSP